MADHQTAYLHVERLITYSETGHIFNEVEVFTTDDSNNRLPLIAPANTLLIMPDNAQLEFYIGYDGTGAWHSIDTKPE